MHDSLHGQISRSNQPLCACVCSESAVSASDNSVEQSDDDFPDWVRGWQRQNGAGVLEAV
jgi:hypothetical protein